MSLYDDVQTHFEEFGYAIVPSFVSVDTCRLILTQWCKRVNEAFWAETNPLENHR